jgi:hypothetical protein
MIPSISIVLPRRLTVVLALQHGVDVHVIGNKPVEARPPAARPFSAKEGRLLSFFDCRRKVFEVLFKASVTDGLVNP